ncbi:DNA polymerase-3 subunit epsilon [Bosea psychrotolerans]|uniref:DNA polymerase-3 subunit epsilon n=2 Tax=Bosea psychrotolerans TaxID=1871628 RepID=A0A2S4MHE7_9HYPH|nr:DNA polymerase-3 subunit epsilon [Bosea psychrotolerans]
MNCSGESQDGNSAPSDAERLARRLEKEAGYRVLRELPVDQGVDRLELPHSDLRIGVSLDVETTGLSPQHDRIVELAIKRFTFDSSGKIHSVERERSWQEDPGGPMPPRVSRLTGLTDAQLRGRQFDDDAIAEFLGRCELVIAHNAKFDRPFFESRFPNLRNLAWACSLTQLDWLDLGFDGRALGHLLFQSGWYFAGHRAAGDVCALTKLLGQQALDGRSVLSHLLAVCDRVTFRLDAVGAPFESKDLLKNRAYQWSVEERFWWREIDEDALVQEKQWLESNVYFGRGSPKVQEIRPNNRFR